MIVLPRLPESLAALLCLLLACSCDRASDPVAGGDDMGNFLQALVLDEAGSPIRGRVEVVSDVDTLSVELHADGKLILPTRARSWILVRVGDEAYLLSEPPDSGSMGTLKLGAPRRLVGWSRSAVRFAIRGLGDAVQEGGFFRFAAVPPGRPLLEAGNDSFATSLPLDLDLDRLAYSGASRDSFVMAPVVASRAGIGVASRSDTSACGTGCPLWFYDLDNTVLRDIPQYDLDTAVGFSGLADSSLVTSVLRAEARGGWILFDLLLPGASVLPVFEFELGTVPTPQDSQPAPAALNYLLVAGRMANDSLRLSGTEAPVVRRVALWRGLPVGMQDRLSVIGATEATLSPSDSVAAEVCSLRADSTSRLCGVAGREWILKP